jgi:hypothetical protein
MSRGSPKAHGTPHTSAAFTSHVDMLTQTHAHIYTHTHFAWHTEAQAATRDARLEAASAERRLRRAREGGHSVASAAQGLHCDLEDASELGQIMLVGGW